MVNFCGILFFVKEGMFAVKVYVIRHGQSEANRLDVYAGWEPVALSDKGLLQVRRTRDLLREIPFDRVYSSDLPRARQSAREIVPYLDPICTDQLREINPGAISGMSLEECHSRFGQQYLDCERQQDFACFGGETQQQMASRIQGFLRRLEREAGLTHVAVVGHEGTVHQFLCHALGAPILLEHLSIPNASVTVLEYAGGSWKLLSFGQGGPFRA